MPSSDHFPTPSASTRATRVYEGVLVYEDEIALLEADGIIFGTTFLKPNTDGVYERVDPSSVSVPDDE